MRTLDKEDRLRLLRFICSFAWTDLQITDDERDYVRWLADRLDIDADERAAVDGWLSRPPDPEEVDPIDIPREHRELFVRMARNVAAADGKVAADERDHLQLFEELLR